MLLLDIILYLIVCWIFPNKEKGGEQNYYLIDEQRPHKPKYRMREVENEDELFFTDKCDFDDAFKF